jgi:tetratricopeptide (TPR) repeat protein
MKEFVSRFPDDARGRYFLGNELIRAGDWAGGAEHYAAYLRLEPADEGTGYKNYGRCLEELGRKAEAIEAYRKGIDRALTHHHEGLAEEIRLLLAAVSS